MAIKFEKIQPGMTLYDNHRTKMGNTTMSRMGEWPVTVKEVDAVNRRAFVSWNGNRPEWWSSRRLSKLYITTMDERKAKREARKAKSP